RRESVAAGGARSAGMPARGAARGGRPRRAPAPSPRRHGARARHAPHAREGLHARGRGHARRVLDGVQRLPALAGGGAAQLGVPPGPVREDDPHRGRVRQAHRGRREGQHRTICPGGAASPCANITHEQGHLYQSVGPPYMLHNTDFKKVMPTWWELMKPVYAQDKGDILADMFAYTYAAVHHGVSHVQLENYMVSNSRAGGEAWRFVDSLASMSCHDPEAALEGRKRPGFLHAASHFKACTNGEHIPYEAEECPESGSDLWNFHKGHVPSTILSCDEPLITPPPDDLFNKQKGVIGKRSAFMICHLTFMVNRAALDYKAKFCASGFNANKCTRLVLGPNQRPALGNQFGYPLARVDQECNK
ncbi:unnamed protein product, partial [Prorocentrum cordatum]